MPLAGTQNQLTKNRLPEPLGVVLFELLAPLLEKMAIARSSTVVPKGLLLLLLLELPLLNSARTVVSGLLLWGWCVVPMFS